MRAAVMAAPVSWADTATVYLHSVFIASVTGNVVKVGFLLSEGDYDGVAYFVAIYASYALGYGCAHLLLTRAPFGAAFRSTVVALLVALLFVLADAFRDSNDKRPRSLFVATFGISMINELGYYSTGGVGVVSIITGHTQKVVLGTLELLVRSPKPRASAADVILGSTLIVTYYVFTILAGAWLVFGTAEMRQWALVPPAAVLALFGVVDACVAERGATTFARVAGVEVHAQRVPPLSAIGHP